MTDSSLSITSAKADSGQHSHYELVAKVISHLFEHHKQQPSLTQLAGLVGVSEHHLQRVFSEWAGVSPKQFLKFLTVEYAKRQLQHNPVLETALVAGLSGSGRLHDLFISCESMTPGEYRQGGQGLCIEYGVLASPFGGCFLAHTQRGVCKLAFFDNDQQLNLLLQELQGEWPRAQLRENTQSVASLGNTIFSSLGRVEAGEQTGMQQATGHSAHSNARVHLLLKGSPFRLQVWKALLALPSGSLTSYQQVAEAIGQPSSTRAVASAIANNPIGLLIPCHRVIRSSGLFNQYRWGAERKRVLIGWEQSCSL